jgi:hypothetical protein
MTNITLGMVGNEFDLRQKWISNLRPGEYEAGGLPLNHCFR